MASFFISLPCHLVLPWVLYTVCLGRGVSSSPPLLCFGFRAKEKPPPEHKSRQGSTNFLRSVLLCYIVRRRWAALIFLFRYCRKASKEGNTGLPITAVISASSSSYMPSCVGSFAPVLSRSAMSSQNVAINPLRVASLFQSCFISKVFVLGCIIQVIK